MIQNKVTKFILLITLFFMFNNRLYSEDNICTLYLKSKTPTQTLNKLKSDSTPKAQFCVGAMYFKGVGVEQNLSQSFQWIKKSAKQGYPPAESNLGSLYVKGIGIDSNNSAAYNWYLKAAKQNYALAQCALGNLYYEGKGVEQDYIKALKWLQIAKENDCQKVAQVINNTFSVINWRKTNHTFTAALLLFDQNGTQYPNTSNEYLSVKEGSELNASIYFSGCTQDTNNYCTETTKIAIFRPDWSLARKWNINLFKSYPIKYNNTLQLSDVRIEARMEDDDPKGQYHILVTIYDSNKKAKTTLNQSFWLK